MILQRLSLKPIAAACLAALTALPAQALDTAARSAMVVDMSSGAILLEKNVDAPLPQGQGRFALEPRVFAKMLDGARIGPDDLILDLAPGLGYSTAVIARMCAAVIAIEPDEALAAAAAEALAAQDVDNAMVRQGAPAEGDPAHGPFDAIFINGAVGEAPQALLDQLKDGGRLVAITVDGEHGRAEVVVRSGDRFTTRRLFDAAAPVIPGFEKQAEFAL